jgi:hypothetical protein
MSLLLKDIVRPDIRPDTNATSYKDWARAFATNEDYTIRPSTRAVFDLVFGERVASDELRYSQDVGAAPTKSEFVRNEADIVRLFNKQIAGPVMEYWRGRWLISQSSESAPLFVTQFQGVVDTHFFYPQGYDELTTVEFKAPGAIDSTWWSDEDHSSGARRLGRELRGSVFAPRA